MAKHELRITISERGDVEVQAAGFSGPSCLDATKFLEEAVGVVSSQEVTEDYYREVSVERVTEGGG